MSEVFEEAKLIKEHIDTLLAAERARAEAVERRVKELEAVNDSQCKAISQRDTVIAEQAAEIERLKSK